MHDDDDLGDDEFDIYEILSLDGGSSYLEDTHSSHSGKEKDSGKSSTNDAEAVMSSMTGNKLLKKTTKEATAAAKAAAKATAVRFTHK